MDYLFTPQELERFNNRLKETLSKLLKEEVKVFSEETVSGTWFRVYTAGSNFLCTFQVKDLPGKVLLSFDMHVDTNYRNMGVATAVQQFKDELCKYLGYKTMLCFVRKDNAPQIRVLSKTGWKLSGELDATRDIYVKEIS